MTPKQSELHRRLNHALRLLRAPGARYVIGAVNHDALVTGLTALRAEYQLERMRTYHRERRRVIAAMD